MPQIQYSLVSDISGTSLITGLEVTVQQPDNMITISTTSLTHTVIDEYEFFLRISDTKSKVIIYSEKMIFNVSCGNFDYSWNPAVPFYEN